MHSRSLKFHPLWLVAAALPLLGAWDLSGLDLALAHRFAGPTGFALREHWLLTHVLHDGARIAAWVLALALVAAVWWPVAGLQRLSFHRRLQLATTPMVITVLINLVKSWSGTSCPWSLSDFGGVATYHSHWLNFLHSDGGSGRCFPAGHATAGFAFVGGYWAFRDTDRGVARVWLAASLAVGLVLGVAQQMRGAHFMSHTLWSGWIACSAAMLVNALFERGWSGGEVAA